MTSVILHDDPADFLRSVGEHLSENEALNNHLFGVVGTAVRGGYADGDNLWLSAHDGGRVVGCALRTPPWPFAISAGATLDAASALTEHAAQYYAEMEFNLPPELVSPVETVVGPLEARLGQGIYQLTDVVFPEGVSGQLRASTEWDVELVAKWAAGFLEDVELPDGRSERELRRMARDLIADESLVIWEVNGAPVSMAAARGPTPNGIRISWVYTPREHRRHGYASACVAGLSQRELDGGRAFCFLFTELSNPTSNHIYQQIGYERVGSLSRYRKR